MSIPRVLVVMEAHWLRTLLLAALQEAGYDTLGAATVAEALAQPAREPGRAPIGLIIVDHHISQNDSAVTDLLRHFPGAAPLRLQSALQPSNPTTDSPSLRYPVSIGDVVQRVEDLCKARGER
jgi:CheY-like chemotaxis protein